VVEANEKDKMNRIYFVRHGEGQDNVARQFSYKKVDRPLTERGQLQAMQTAEHLAGVHIDAIFCSPMKRTHETAQIIADRLNMSLTVLEELREINVGDLEGQDFNDENWGTYHDVTNEWYMGNLQASYPNGEDYEMLWARLQRGLKSILDEHSGCNFVIAGHGGIFIATLRDLCPELGVSWLQNAEMYNCAITELEVELMDGELKGKMVDWANYHHMSEDVLSKKAAIPPLNSIKRTEQPHAQTCS
jgi:broad specificity phosphatase PhoE